MIDHRQRALALLSAFAVVAFAVPASAARFLNAESDWGALRFLSHQLERPRVRVWKRVAESHNGPAHCLRDRKVQRLRSERNVARHGAVRRVHRGLDRDAGLGR